MNVHLRNKYNSAHISWGTFTILSSLCLLLLFFKEVRYMGFIVNFLQLLGFIFSFWWGNVKFRKECILESNNHKNPKKNICMLAVFEYLGLADKVEYLHTKSDGVDLVNSEFDVLEIPNCYVGDVLKMEGLYLTFVTGHVLLIENGKVIVDTYSTPVMQKTVGIYKLSDISPREF